MVMMTESQTSVVLSLMLAESENKESFDKGYREQVKDVDFICQIIEKRIKAFKLPTFEPSAVMMLSMFAQGNPGRAVISIIDTLDTWKRLGGIHKISGEFVATHVYPMGIYSQEEFETVWDAKKLEPKDQGYNFII
jgi:hypothetical protein